MASRFQVQDEISEDWQSPIVPSERAIKIKLAIGNRQTLNLLFVNLAAMVYTPAVVPSLPKNTRFRRVPPCHNLSAGSCVSTITKIRQTCSPCSFLRRTMTLFARSEERRVGKECRSRWSRYLVRKNSGIMGKYQ